MNSADLCSKYLNDSRVMQLATVAGDQPWICSVYFVTDDNHNLYWLSLPSRQHSQEIAQQPNVAAAIAVKLDQPIIGIQISGRAEIISDDTVIAAVMATYISKYNTGHDFLANFKVGSNKHRLYCLRPSNIILFDEVHYPDSPRQIIDIKTS